MKIQAVKFYQNGFMTEPFAFGGEDGMEAFDAGKKYRSCLQNYVIDTGNEVILVDTGLPAARETLNRVHEFVSKHPTVYMGTHTPLGYENLEKKRVVDLNNPPKTLPVGRLLSKPRAANMFVRFAAVFMTLQKMTAPNLRTCRKIGVALVADSRKPNLTPLR